MALSRSQVECLLVALLAVNSFALEKAQSLLPRLRAAGLSDPVRVNAMNMPEVIEALTVAGYDRKNLTWMFAERVKALMMAIERGELTRLEEAIAATDKELAATVLRRVRGVGPTVIQNAWSLITAQGGN